MNLGNLIEKWERKGMYCAQCRSKYNVDEIGQLTEERKTQKESSFNITQSMLLGMGWLKEGDRDEEKHMTHHIVECLMILELDN